MSKHLRLLTLPCVVLVVLAGSLPAGADNAAQPLPFAQNWSDTSLITINDDWSGVPGIVGYRGDGLTDVNDVDPQTVLGEGAPPVVDVNANQTNPDTFTTGGVTEFHLSNPSIALAGSGTADAPSIVLNVSTLGHEGIRIAYNLRDLDGSVDNAVQQVALQYRLGSSGNFTNLPAGYVSDATTGPSQAILLTPVSVTLPAAAGNQPLVQLRVITTNASGSDEWVGVDAITVVGTDLPEENAPAVSSTSPANGAVNVATDADVAILFNEPVNVSGAWYTISCSRSGSHEATVSGGPTTFVLDPSSDFMHDETCTVTIAAGSVTDQDVDDPPDEMAADYSFSFSTTGIPATIQQIQGAAHLSPLVGRRVAGVAGVVTAVRPLSFYMQDPDGDGDDATSDGILVFGVNTSGLTVGTVVLVDGRVTEFRPGGSGGVDNLTITELDQASFTSAGPGPTVVPTVLGEGGRTQPDRVIENDATGSVETSGVFDPAEDGIDFYESLESMIVQVNDGAVVGATRSFGEITLLADGGENATGLRTARGGILLSPFDANPERITVDDEILRDLVSPRPPKAMPDMNVGAHVTSPVVGPLDYSFENYKIQALSTPVFVESPIVREVAAVAHPSDLTVATFNVENLTVGNPQSKFDELAGMIVNNLRSPAIVGIEEVQDDNGTTNDGTVDASQTWGRLIDALEAAGGHYDYRQIDPVDDQDGGAPGGNIRVGFLFRTDLPELAFVDRPGGTPTTEVSVEGPKNHPRLSFSPGRLGTQSTAFADTRKSLAGEFVWKDRTVFVVVNHFSSKGDDQGIFSRWQPPTNFSEGPRHGQAQLVNDFVDEIVALDRDANVIVLGDINDFEFSRTIEILEGGVLTTLMDILPPAERYSYVFEGNSQVLDQILVSHAILKRAPAYDVVHVNSEFADARQASDHEPQVAYLRPKGTGEDE